MLLAVSCVPLIHVALALAACVPDVEVVYWPSERKKMKIVARAAMKTARGLKRRVCREGILSVSTVVRDYSIAAPTYCL